MRSTTHKMLAVLAVAVLVAAFAPVAGAKPVFVGSPDARDANAASAVDLRMPDTRDAASSSPTSSVSSDSGDSSSTDGAIAAGGAIALLIVAGGMTVVARRRKSESPVVPG
jgi:hypothetical protein